MADFTHAIGKFDILLHYTHPYPAKDDWYRAVMGLSEKSNPAKVESARKAYQALLDQRDDYNNEEFRIWYKVEEKESEDIRRRYIQQKKRIAKREKTYFREATNEEILKKIEGDTIRKMKKRKNGGGAARYVCSENIGKDELKQLVVNNFSLEELKELIASNFSLVEKLKLVVDIQLENEEGFWKPYKIVGSENSTAKDEAKQILRSLDGVMTMHSVGASKEMVMLEYPTEFGLPFIEKWDQKVDCGGELASDRAKHLISEEGFSACSAIQIVMFEYPLSFGLSFPEGWSGLQVDCGGMSAHRRVKWMFEVEIDGSLSASIAMQLVILEFPKAFPDVFRETKILEEWNPDIFVFPGDTAFQFAKEKVLNCEHSAKAAMGKVMEDATAKASEKANMDEMEKAVAETCGIEAAIAPEEADTDEINEAVAEMGGFEEMEDWVSLLNYY